DFAPARRDRHHRDAVAVGPLGQAFIAVDLQIPEAAGQHPEADQREQAADPGAQLEALPLLLAGLLELEHGEAQTDDDSTSSVPRCGRYSTQPTSGQMAAVSRTEMVQSQPGHLPASQAKTICCTSRATKNTGSMCIAWLQRSKRCRRRCRATAP